MKTIFILFALISFTSFSFQTSTWRDSELMNVVNQRLSTYSSQSQPQTSQPAESTSHHELSQIQASHVSPSNEQSSSRRRRERKGKNIIQSSEPMQTHDANKAIIKEELSSEHATSKSRKRKNESSDIYSTEQQITKKKKMSEEQRILTKQRMLKDWAPGGRRREAHEKKQKVILDALTKAQLNKSPSPSHSPNSPKTAEKPAPKKNQKTTIKIEPQDN